VTHLLTTITGSVQRGLGGLGLLQGDAAEAVAGLKRRPSLELQVHGSGDLVSTLARHYLVD
jgi:hypothetical protein